MLKEGNTAIDIYIQYKKNKQKCGRKLIQHINKFTKLSNIN